MPWPPCATLTLRCSAPGQIIARNGNATYAILFGIVFAETGLVLTPFLPGKVASAQHRGRLPGLSSFELCFWLQVILYSLQLEPLLLWASWPCCP